jgi:chloramphenicol 3-O phosphotransferase
VDDVIFQPEVWEMMQRILGPHDLVRVGVRCPLEVAEAREASRGDRFPGLVRAHYPFMSSITGYDFEVDSSRTTAEEAATLIRDYVLSR